MPDDIRQVREDVVRRHIDAENCGDVEAVIATFHRPRYNVVPMGQVTEGESAVRELMSGLMRSFPDFRFEQQAIHHADSAVILEGLITGTQREAWGGIPPAGQRMNVPVACVFAFEGTRLMNETVYFDFATAARQLAPGP